MEIADRLFREAKRHAAEHGTSLRQVIEDALRAHLGRGRAQGKYRLTWNTERGKVLPGVRLDDRDALYDVMEDRR